MRKRELSQKTQKMLAMLAIVIFLAGSGLIFWKVGLPMLRFASRPEAFRQWVNDHGISGRLAYIGMVILQIVVAVIPGEPFEIAAGYSFGIWEGTFLCLLGASIGSVLVFLLVRIFGTRLAEVFFSQEKLQSLHFLKDGEKRNFLFLLLFMIPGTPKDLLCYFAGLTDIRFPVFLLISSLGRFPSIITSTVGGDALGTKNYLFAGVVFAATFGISSLGLWIYHVVCARKKEDQYDNYGNGTEV